MASKVEPAALNRCTVAQGLSSTDDSFMTARERIGSTASSFEKWQLERPLTPTLSPAGEREIRSSFWFVGVFVWFLGCLVLDDRVDRHRR